MKIIQRKGTLILWLIKKRIVIEIRLPIFIWKTNEDSEIIRKTKIKKGEKNEIHKVHSNNHSHPAINHRL